MLGTSAQSSHQAHFSNVNSDDHGKEELADLINHHVRLLLPEMQLVLESSIQRTLRHPVVHVAEQKVCQGRQASGAVQQKPGSVAECYTSPLGVSFSEASGTNPHGSVDRSPAITAVAGLLQPLQDSLSRVEKQLAALNEKSQPCGHFDAQGVIPVREAKPSFDTTAVARPEIPNQQRHKEDYFSEVGQLSDVQLRFPHEDEVPGEHLQGAMTKELEEEALEASPLRVVFSYVPKNRITVGMMRLCEWISEQKEPPRRGLLANLIHSNKFELVCVLVILVNAVFAAFQADWEVANVNKQPERTMTLFSLFFCGFYVFEITLKLAVHGGYFFINDEWKWNIFDILLVVLALYDQFTAQFLEQTGANLSFMRTFRLMKLTRVVRLFRVLKFFRSCECL